MRKQVFGRKFKRDKNERKALFKSLLSELVLHDRIKTTEAKAKAIKGKAEKLVTKAIKKGLAGSASMQEYLIPQAIEKLVNQVAPVFKNRPGGYTRIIRLGKRFHDNAAYVMLEWVEKPNEKDKNEVDKSSKENKKTVITETQKKSANAEARKKNEMLKKSRVRKTKTSK